MRLDVLTRKYLVPYEGSCEMMRRYCSFICRQVSGFPALFLALIVCRQTGERFSRLVPGSHRVVNVSTQMTAQCSGARHVRQHQSTRTTRLTTADQWQRQKLPQAVPFPTPTRYHQSLATHHRRTFKRCNTLLTVHRTWHLICELSFFYRATLLQSPSAPVALRDFFLFHSCFGISNTIKLS